MFEVISMKISKNARFEGEIQFFQFQLGPKPGLKLGQVVQLKPRQPDIEWAIEDNKYVL